MQQLNFVNDVFTISYWNEGYSLKSWCERVIKVKRGRLSYEDISSLDFVNST